MQSSPVTTRIRISDLRNTIIFYYGVYTSIYVLLPAKVSHYLVYCTSIGGSQFTGAKSRQSLQGR